MTVEYDGSGFCGWQAQPGQRTVQTTIEGAIGSLTGESVSVLGSGRTDSGVHALGQVCAFDTSSGIPPDRFSHALNAKLPEDVRAVRSWQAADGFNPRFDAKGKTYGYLVLVSPVRPAILRGRFWHVTAAPDVGAMAEACPIIEGEHDFAAFCASGGGAKGTVRNVRRLSVEAHGPDPMPYMGRGSAVIGFTVSADGFLYNMVRIIVGTLMDVGYGRIGLREVGEAVATGSRGCAGITAPAAGLCLLEVNY